MILKYTNVRLLLQPAASISRFFVYVKNSDGCDHNNCVTMSRDHVCTNRAMFPIVTDNIITSSYTFHVTSGE